MLFESLQLYAVFKVDSLNINHLYSLLGMCVVCVVCVCVCVCVCACVYI